MSIPTGFTFAQQLAALKALGLDHQADIIASVLLEPHQMTVVTHDLNENGRVHLGPDDKIASTTTVIPVVTTSSTEVGA